MAKTSRQIRPHRNHFPTRARSASSCRMTHAPPEARPPRPRGEYRWPPRKAHAFLEALALHGKVAAAARAVGMTRQSAYKLKQRVPVVAEGWTRAQAIGRARRRGKPVLSGDEGGRFRAAMASANIGTIRARTRRFRRKATLRGMQGDAFHRQGDSSGRKATLLPSKATVSACFGPEHCHRRQHPVVRDAARAIHRGSREQLHYAFTTA